MPYRRGRPLDAQADARDSRMTDSACQFFHLRDRLVHPTFGFTEQIKRHGLAASEILLSGSRHTKEVCPVLGDTAEVGQERERGGRRHVTNRTPRNERSELGAAIGTQIAISSLLINCPESQPSRPN